MKWLINFKQVEEKLLAKEQVTKNIPGDAIKTIMIIIYFVKVFKKK